VIEAAGDYRSVPDFQAVLPETDVLTVHLPLGPDSRALIGAPELTALPDTAFVINAARGGIVDEAALAAALKAGRLAGAALDVFEEEPLSAASAARFAGVPNLILTPHIAGRTVECDIRVSAVVAAGVRRVLGGG
jgi:(S)-sulfolactate dehydrogenase